MADEIKGKHQQVMDSKPTITDDSWTDQHNQDFPYLFADGSHIEDSSGVDSSTGSEYWSGDGKEDWTVDFGGPLTYKPTVEKPPPKSILFLMNYMAKKYSSNKRIAKKMRKRARALAKRRKKAAKEKEKAERREKRAADLMEKTELLLMIQEKERLKKEQEAKKRRK